MSARALIDQYLCDLATVLRAVQVALGTSDTDGVLRQFVFEAREGRPRAGEIDTIRYRVHGTGCEFVILSAVVDVDFDPELDGRPTFDAWRIRRYAESKNAMTIGDTEVDIAFAGLVEAGLLTQSRPGWFTTRRGWLESTPAG
jgi:hypothetical protein